MSLARAFSRRVNNKDKRPELSLPMRFGSIRAAATSAARRNNNFNDGPMKRPNISSPIQLVSTTNMLSFSAPDIAKVQDGGVGVGVVLSLPVIPHVASSASSTTSADVTDSEVSLVSDNGTDASSLGSVSPSPDRNSVGYFENKQTTKVVVAEDSIAALDWSAPLPPKSLKRASSVMLPSPAVAAPELPKRALSHSKRAHERLARQRSVRSSIQSLNSSLSSSSSPDRSPVVAAQLHPFSAELEQLDEMAEDFAGLDLSNVEAEADAAVMQTKGLMRFAAADYACEIDSLRIGVFDDEEVREGWF